MKKNILNLNEVSIITKKEQQSINGGFWGGCEPQIIICETDSDCPCGSCGIDVGIFIEGICAY